MPENDCFSLRIAKVGLDARAIKDAATFDGKTFYPHVEELFVMYPEIQSLVERVLYDSASDSDEIKEKFKNNLGIEVKASFNPRGKKEITEDVPRGIAKITPYGIPVCKGGYEMEYQGMSTNMRSLSIKPRRIQTMCRYVLLVTIVRIVAQTLPVVG